MPAFGVVEPYKLVQSCDTPIMLLGCTCNSVQGTGLPPTWCHQHGQKGNGIGHGKTCTV